MSSAVSSFRLLAKRSYATRSGSSSRKNTSNMPRTKIAQKPPTRPTDPLIEATTTKSLDDGELTFIHRAPPTAPTPHSTTMAPSSPLLRPPTVAKGPVRLPPLLRPSEYVAPPPRMSDEQLAELQRLRALDPEKWTRSRLAEKFNCTSHFVALKAAMQPSQRKKANKEFDAKIEAVKEQWGHRKTLIREIAAKRKTFW
ncbi:hypothetical protein FIBSPDRAFT_924487 [Athelia psychrophila]|uniref:60S ribosomal protein L20 n=1 Tax=Athelia psychrophila TaxID=1759441 RepID=A0A166W8J9_9AGAM|nr:hypothetical protein FIBSPDRAFT_924487 [Fibularhizoctonia sp. CBS 109695]